jgi:hypothetical protein
MICGSGGRGAAADALGTGTTSVADEGGIAEALALDDGSALTDPANPCTASTITSGGGFVFWQDGITLAMALVKTMRGTKRGVLIGVSARVHRQDRTITLSLATRSCK